MTAIHAVVELGDDPHVEIGKPHHQPRLGFRDDERGLFELILASDQITFPDELAGNC